jgi:membrane dipeptidase
MTPDELHSDAIVIDGLEIANWSRAVFDDMRRGGLTAVNCTCAVWEDFDAAMDNIAAWKLWLKQHADILRPVHGVEDIHRAKAENRTGIILGWQNTSGIEDRPERLRLFKELGVGCMQLTYNTQNLVGSGCWESRDGGLSDFGREVIDVMNEVGILIDLSHVGARTSEEAIRYSGKPVAYTHCAPAALRAHPRNKTDEQLRFIVEHGGFVGFATYPPFLPAAEATTVADCVQILEYLINLLGEESVGIGTDFTQDQPPRFFEYLSHDKGHRRRLVPPKPGAGVTVMPQGLRTIGEFPNLTRAMLERGWPEMRIRRVIGENWLRFLGEVWEVRAARQPRGVDADSLPKRELERSVEELRSEVAALGERDRTAQRRLESLITDLEHKIEHPADAEHHRTLVDNLRETIEQFEVKHPTATGVLNHIMVTLGNMGI